MRIVKKVKKELFEIRVSDSNGGNQGDEERKAKWRYVDQIIKGDCENIGDGLCKRDTDIN